jgi:cardiolipin synthase
MGIAVGATLGVLARRWWDRRARAGALGSLRMGLTEGVDQVGLALMQATGVSFLDGNRLAWRDNGEVFDAIEESIRTARNSVHVDVYIWKPGKAGTRIAELVCRLGTRRSRGPHTGRPHGQHRLRRGAVPAPSRGRMRGAVLP